MSDGSPFERLAFPREALIRAQQLAMSYKILPGGMVTGVGGAVLLAFGLPLLRTPEAAGRGSTGIAQ